MRKCKIEWLLLFAILNQESKGINCIYSTYVYIVTLGFYLSNRVAYNYYCHDSFNGYLNELNFYELIIFSFGTFQAKFSTKFNASEVPTCIRNIYHIYQLTAMATINFGKNV